MVVLLLIAEWVVSVYTSITKYQKLLHQSARDIFEVRKQVFKPVGLQMDTQFVKNMWSTI